MSEKQGWRIGLSAAFVLTLLPAPVARAQETTFNPSVSAGSGYVDPVEFVGTSQDEESDTTLGFGLTLPVTSTRQGRGFQFRYDLEARRYQDNSDLDDTNHRLVFDMRRTNRHDGRWSLRAGFVDTTEQAYAPILPTAVVPGSEPGSVDDSDLTITERLRRRTLTAATGYDWRAGDRWRIGVGIAAFTSDVSGVSDPDGGIGAEGDIEDRDGYGVNLRAERTVSRRTRLGARYAYQYADLEISGEEKFNEFAFTSEHDLSRRFSLGLELGVLRRTVEASNEDDTEVTGNLELAFNDGLTAGPVRIDFGFGFGPSPGGALEGTSMNSSASVGFSGVRARPWNWRTALRFTRRDPFDNALATTDTASAGASVERSISRTVGLRTGASWIDQSSDDPGLDARFLRADLNVIWYPLAGSRLSGR